jgi:hypothetical protein
VDAGDVAGRGYHATLATANDHRPVLQRGVVALFNGRIKRIAVDMREMQPVEFRMTGEPWASAPVASPCLGALEGQAVAAKTVIGIVDSSRHCCEHKENRCNGTSGR